ncbi:MAG: hypothetical protein HND48_00950 [Chloroflexi bacterium]|nr:hypothetical protein [Chloroflexota bacterium]
MHDITVIREKPDFVKAELLRLQDEQAAGRIDTILELDKQRRTLLAQSEAIQQHRNRLNKGIGRLRGDKSLDDAARAQRAGQIVALIAAGDYAAAADVIEGNGSTAPAAPVEFQTLLDALAGMGDTVNGYNAQIREIDAALQDNLLWLPNLPHESTPLRRERRRQQAVADGRRSARVRLRAEAALGSRPGARHHRL